VETEFFPYIREHGISFIPFYPLASGLLTGKYDKNCEVSEKNKKRPQFQPGVYERNLEKIEKVRQISKGKGAEVSHVVLAWYLTREEIDVVIPGAKNADQVLHNLKTLDVQLTAEEIQSIDEIFHS
jgi:aryl-alcohol dehydrogenase-like predicted oxidoreductase